MSALEQSLDAIISSDKVAQRARARKNTASKVGKSSTKKTRAAKKVVAATVAAAALKKARKAKQKRNVGAAIVDPSSVDLATKVVVSGLPHDIKPENVKVCYFKLRRVVLL